MPLTATLFLDDDASAPHDDASERRAASRRSVGKETTLRRSGLAIEAVLHDLSVTGAAIETAASLAPGAAVTIGLPGVGRVAARVVSAAAPRFGCRFDTPLQPGAVATAFERDPIVVGPFHGEGGPAISYPETPDRYPGVVRLGLPIGGALVGWALIIHAARLLIG